MSLQSATKSIFNVPRKAGDMRLQFPPGAPEGFNNAASAQFNAKETASSVREIIQNAMDAALVDGDSRRAEVRFAIRQIRIGDIPAMADHLQATRLAISQHKKPNKQTKNISDAILRHAEKSESDDTCLLLTVCDNGCGLDRGRLSAILADGQSWKNNEGASGSYGNGHLTTFSLSAIRMLFYIGVLANNETLYAGHAILASRQDQYEGRLEVLGKNGYYVKNINTSEMDVDRYVYGNYADIDGMFRADADFIRRQYGHGAVIAVPFFNNFGLDKTNPCDLIAKEAAKHFFAAISLDKLRIEVIDQTGDSTLIDKSRITRMLEEMRVEKRASNRLFASGYRVWEAFMTYQSGKTVQLQTNFGAITAKIRPGSAEKRVTLCRNGMWITDNIPRLAASDFGDRVNFNALLLLDSAQDDCPAFELLKLAETQLHNELKANLINDRKMKNDFRQLIREIQQQLRLQVDEKNAESFMPGNFLELHASGEGEGEGGGKKKDPAAPITINIAKTGKTTKDSNGREGNLVRLMPKRGRGIASKFGGKRDDARMRIVIAPAEDCPSAAISLHIDAGQDPACARAQTNVDWQIPIKSAQLQNKNGDFESASIDELNQIALGRISKGCEYHLHIEFAMPPGQRFTQGDFAMLVHLNKSHKIKYRREAIKAADDEF